MTKPLLPRAGQPGHPAADGLIHDPDRQQMMFCNACGGQTMHTVSQAWKPQEPWRVTKYTTVCLTCSLQRGKTTPGGIAMTDSRHQLWPVPGSGRRKGNYRLVTRVDLRKKTGWAFEGSWLEADGREIDLPIGSVVVRKTPTGSMKRQSADWHYALVPETGAPWDWSEAYDQKRFLSFRDAVAQTLNGTNTNGQDLHDDQT